MKKFFIAAWLLLLAGTAGAQLAISIDLSVLRNLGPGQQFWAMSQTVQVQRGLGPRDALYGWVTVATPGRFRTGERAVARTAAVFPTFLDYPVRSEWVYREASLGWRHYFTGRYAGEKQSVYAYGGFGLLFGKVTNTFDRPVDTARYRTFGPMPGSGTFRKLTFDGGIGTEWPLGGGVYLYGDLRTFLPFSSYPTPYIPNSRNVPTAVAVAAGLRVVFD